MSAARTSSVRALALVLAALLLVAPAAARADGDGTAMFGVTAGPAPAGAVACDAPATADAEEAAEAAAAAAAQAFEAAEAIAGDLARHEFLAQAAPPAPAPAPAPTPRARARVVRAPRIERVRVETDTLVTVRRGTRLELHNFGGAVTLGTWKKDAVHVHAEHGQRDRIELRQHDGVLRVEAISSQAVPQTVEYRLEVPAWLPVSLSGVYNDVTADGLEGGLSVETVRGDIAVKRALGVIDLSSVEGLVDLAEAKGQIKVSSVNDGVRLVRVGGDIEAEAVNGDIQMLDLSSLDVEATTVNGAVLFDGRLYDGGNYRFSTHSGDIALGLTDQSNATVTVSTYAGEFESPFPIRLSRTQPGKRFAFALGNGKAKVDLESFQGAIQLYRPGDRAVLERFRESWNESERERTREQKWIFKGVPAVPDPPDPADPDAPTVRVIHKSKKQDK